MEFRALSHQLAANAKHVNILNEILNDNKNEIKVLIRNHLYCLPKEIVKPRAFNSTFCLTGKLKFKTVNE